MIKTAWVLVVIGSLCVADVRAQDAPPPSATTATSRGATKPVIGEAAWKEHELRLKHGWVAVEEELDLRAVDLQSLTVREEVEGAEGEKGPVLASDGSIEFVFGEAIPTIFCRPMTICDIALQDGERIVKIAAGTGRGGAWHVGQVHSPRPHIVVRPKRHTAERTNLAVWTDRRSYHFDLALSETPMRFVSFRFPEDERLQLLAAENAQAMASAVKQEENGSGGPFSPRPWEWQRNYEVKCASRFWVCRRIKWMKPEDVSDDGNVTQITLPVEALSQGRPVFHVISATGQREQVNYSVHGRTYLIPQVFDQGSLIIVNGKRPRHVLEYRIHRTRED